VFETPTWSAEFEQRSTENNVNDHAGHHEIVDLDVVEMRYFEIEVRS